MSQVLVPVSIGELVDKITILTIKTEKIRDAIKLVNIRAELTALEAVCGENGIDLLHSYVEELRQVNQDLWVIEDDIRVLESQKDFGNKFVELARAVYVTNDRRFKIKSDINELYGSALKEEKSYEDYQ